MKEILIGFDSAWTDNMVNPGAITACVIENDRIVRFEPPRLASFDAAADFVEHLSDAADYVLITIDQPTIVPNETGGRPVERVAASLISSLGGGVQPARWGGGGAAMFGDTAPIWRFLARVRAVQDPEAAHTAQAGRFLVEVFPALALPAIVPAIWDRRRAAKYNPAAANFSLDDWQLVTAGVANTALRLGLSELAVWIDAQTALPNPRKADQDRLDAAICLVIACQWRRCGRKASIVIGNGVTGYMLTPVTPGTRLVLEAAATRFGVDVDQAWEGNMPVPITSAEAVKPQPRPVSRETAFPTPDRPARVEVATLRALLVECARAGQLVTYGEIADAFGHAWTQGFGASLRKALTSLSADNRQGGEPQLMCLVVNKESRRPGDGFYAAIGTDTADPSIQTALFEHERARCQAWAWKR